MAIEDKYLSEVADVLSSNKGEHWKDIKRYYNGMDKTIESFRSIVDKATQRVGTTEMKELRIKCSEMEEILSKIKPLLR